MRASLSIACAGLSSVCAGIAWVLQLLPIPLIGLARWFDRQARRLSTIRSQP